MYTRIFDQWEYNEDTPEVGWKLFRMNSKTIRHLLHDVYAKYSDCFECYIPCVYRYKTIRNANNFNSIFTDDIYAANWVKYGRVFSRYFTPDRPEDSFFSRAPNFHYFEQTSETWCDVFYASINNHPLWQTRHFKNIDAWVYNTFAITVSKIIISSTVEPSNITVHTDTYEETCHWGLLGHQATWMPFNTLEELTTNL